MRIFPQSIEKINEPLHVAIYIRTSVNSVSSYGYQESTLKKIIEEHPSWIYEGSYADGISASAPFEDRVGLNLLLKECEAGNIDLVLTKSVSRFSKNVLEGVEITKTLAKLPHPVGVYFEAEGIYSLEHSMEKE